MKRFPPEAETAAKAKIEEALEKLGARWLQFSCMWNGYTFLEAMAERVGKLMISTICKRRIY